MFTLTLLLSIFIGLSTSVVENSERHNLTCVELCELAEVAASQPRIEIKKFILNENNRSKEFPSFLNSPDIVGYDHRNSERWDQYFGKSSIIYGLSQIANEAIVNEKCFKDLKTIENGILRRDPWAMKVLDSSGGKESGFIWGQNYWLGSKQGCAAVKAPVRITLSNQFERTMKEGLINQMAPFAMDYRVVYMKHNSPWQVEIKFMPERIIHIGLCLPSACSLSEIQNMTQSLMDSKNLEENQILDLHAEVMYVKDLKLKDSFFELKSIKIITGCVIFTFILTLVASFLSDTELVNENGFLSKILSFIKCFDLMNNIRKLFAVHESSPDSIPVINGLRSVSCFWIMLFHVVWYMYFTVSNKTFLVSYAEKAFFQYVSTAPLLVDLFFTISGFLQTHNFIKNEKKLDVIRQSTFGQNLKAFGKLVLHRYLRLAPLYLVLTGIVSIFTSYIEDVSVFHISDRYDQVCANYWWRNVLFIQNFFDHNELCLNWSWSLACEMQFFCLLTGLLFVYAKHPTFVKNLMASAVIAVIGWTYIVGLRSHYQLSFDVALHTGTEIYINPFIRIMPYLLGSIAGWYLVQSKGEFEIGTTTEKCIWNMAIVAFFACIYSTIKRDMSFLSTITLLVIGRLTFSIAVCWMIIGSATGRGIWWSRILESKFFQHINRLSYAIYLLNPFVIAFVFSLSNTSSHADPLQLSVLTSGFVVIVYLMSIIFSLAFEIPYCNFSSLLLKRKLKTA
ncbi:nose resistant to fluoxetine protein 6-like [Episyrphus balteatus]|uniref:nose resistant to fluoxetine protein 6-like n=1 Tax=Episyrphus balteatus TaxID=286459 RepID=UPI002485F345|nr:nose resistant to fluoxetine protein 6-like [Episyrphus balteatus]